MMRTTIDLPDDLHALARELAHQRNGSMSEVIAELIRNGLRPPAPPPGSSRRGLPVVEIGRVVTSDDVRTLEDE